MRYIPYYIPVVRILQQSVEVLQSGSRQDTVSDAPGLWIWGGPRTGKWTLVRDIASEIQSTLKRIQSML